MVTNYTRVIYHSDQARSPEPRPPHTHVPVDPGRHRLSVYRCGDFWHLGHLPDDVRHGIITRDELTPPRPRRALEEA